MKRRAIFTTVVFLCSVAILFGCGKDEPIPKPPVPPVPTAVKAAPTAVKGAVVTWTLVSGATAYNIYMASVPNITKETVSSLRDGVVHTATGSPFKIPHELVSGTTYHFRISAVNGESESDLSTEVSTLVSDSSAVALAAGKNHTCALISNGTVKCWGANYSGQLGRDSNGSPSAETSKPRPVLGLNTAIAITAGSAHTCALLINKKVSCWGRGTTGQLGNGTIESKKIPTPVSGITTAEAIQAGEEHTCALLTEGVLQCWGYNKYGQLGDGSRHDSLVPVSANIKRVTFFALGSRHSCADTQPDSSKPDRRVKCWGDNDSGQLGDGTKNEAFVPIDVKRFRTETAGDEVREATALATGSKHTCAIILKGLVNCWGEGESGQLGDGQSGATAGATSPALVPGIATARALAAGAEHMCALLLDDTVTCWGLGDTGQLGAGTLTSAATPTTLLGFTARELVAGASHTCALTFEGRVKCWGSNEFGQLGNGEFSNADTPKEIIPSGVTAVSAGKGHTCAMVNGGIKCWGDNFHGQLGDGTVLAKPTRVDAKVLDPVAAVSAGGGHTCARMQSGTGGAKCWGKNKDGQLGDNNKLLSQPLVVSTLGLSTISTLSAGSSHTCAIGVGQATTTPNVHCWGRGSSGQLGYGGVLDAAMPTAVLLSSTEGTVMDIAAGGSHSCARLSTNKMVCWGSSQYGQIGMPPGRNSSSATPITISTFPSGLSVHSIAVGGKHTCAILSNQTIHCFGDNAHGQLGSSAGLPISNPQPVVGITAQDTIQAISAGGSHTCAIISNAVRCWGSNAFGQLGSGTNDRQESASLIVTGLGPGSGVTAISAGDDHTCAILGPSGALKCWGNNTFGQVGLEISTIYTSPIPVVDIP